MFAKNLYFKSQIELEIRSRVEFTQHSHDSHRPGIGRFEHSTLSTRLENFSNKWDNIKKLLGMGRGEGGEGDSSKNQKHMNMPTIIHTCSHMD